MFVDHDYQNLVNRSFESEKIENLKKDKQLEKAQKEWNQIDILPIIDLRGNLISTLDSCISSNQVLCVTFEEVESYYQNLDLSSNLYELKSKSKTNFLIKWIKNFWQECPPIKSYYKINFDRIFALSKYPFDNLDPLHFRFLVTVYQKLTNDYRECPRIGPHWQEIGFQGIDPATDLRGVGILGLYQLLYLILNPKREQLAKDIYKLSLNEYQHFPFATMSTNITSIALQALRLGKLNKIINHNHNVQETFNAFYADLFFTLFQDWKNHHKTIYDAGYILKDLRSMIKNKAYKIFNSSLDYNIRANSIQSLVEFTSIENMF